MQANFFKKYSNIKNAVFHKDTNQLLVLTDYDLHIFNADNIYNIYLTKTLEIITLKTFDMFVDIKFAHYNPNIVLLLSKKALFKKWINKLGENIYVEGGHPDYDFSSLDWMTTAPIDEKTDLLLIKATLNANSYILIFEDQLYTQSLLNNNEFSVYSKEETLIKKDEYISSWVFNKSLKKLLYNLNLLVDNIAFRFYVRKTTENKTSFEENTYFIYSTYNRLAINKSIKDTNRYANLFINENFQSETINRCFTQLYDYQSYILSELVNNEPINLDLTPYRLG